MDQIANMLTSLKNASMARRALVRVPYSRLKQDIADVMRRAGFVGPISTDMEGPQKVLEISMLYENGEPALKDLKRVSKPSRRWYVRKEEVPHVLSGLGVAIISTSKGVLTDQEARKQGLGGEVICKVW